MLPAELKKAIESLLNEKHVTRVEVINSIGVGGGCINETLVLQTTNGKYFIKYNSATAYPGMFEKEAAGLRILSDTNTLAVPGVIGSGEAGKYAFLLLQCIENGTPGKDFWNAFGTGLAALHRNTSEYFGLDYNNYIGSLAQSNRLHPDFNSFLIAERIEPMLKEARNKGAFSQSDMRFFDSLFKSLHNIIPAEIPRTALSWLYRLRDVHSKRLDR